MEPTPVPQIVPPVLPLFVPNGIQDVHTGPNVIADDGDESIANIFVLEHLPTKQAVSYTMT